ncbi:phosphodiester glycosidase family protein [Catenulispora rubra]|uniref:phosphodiester glycosidase family protein n=1 Tax=Catenulispora rubra TaxID=280293 RepID=UPI0018924980|nr:phosphodiester glycosidase family protein [Catenulispora rubra]
MSAKSEELEGLRDGEPTDGDVGAVHGDRVIEGDTDSAGAAEGGAKTGAETGAKTDAQSGAKSGAKSGAQAGAKGIALDETVSLPAVTPQQGDALAETVSLASVGDHDHMRVRPQAATAPLDATHITQEPTGPTVTDVVPVPVPQDVADETARAVAEASAESPASEYEAAANAEAEAESAEAPFPARRKRHTPLYGRGVRVLPWKHKSRLNPAQRRRRKIVVRSLWGSVLVFFGTVSWSVAGALTTPGTDTVQARLAEWGRDHGMGGLVAQLEQWQYDLNPPSKGGSVDAKQFTDLGPTAAAPSAKPSKNGGVPSKPGAPSSQPDLIPMQPRLPAPPGLTLESGEGEFQVAVQTPSGQPVVQVARIRPDATYTGVIADIAVIDQKHSSYVLHPGHEGGLNSVITNVPNQIDANARPNLIALFNGGFKISESHGGYYDHGVTAAPLVDGAASEVIFKDGHMAVGMWGRDYSFQKNTNILSVRQNLKLMVDNGQVVSYIDDSSTWGRADHGSAAVWRSGVGVKADGDIVWVGGNSLTAPTLARLLKDAGAVRAMQLDINLRWADFQYFPARDGNPDNSKLYEDFLQGPNKFFVNSTKDFMAVYLR